MDNTGEFRAAMDRTVYAAVASGVILTTAAAFRIAHSTAVL
jgi:hypothetical protein